MTGVEYVCFDVESTGVDTDNDRIVQLFIGLYAGDGTLVKSHEWLINPGVEVPQAAADVHGFTTEFLQETGADPFDALDEAYKVFLANEDKVWVAFNLNFDLSIIQAEFARHLSIHDFGFFANRDVRLYDAIVVDRGMDKYRRGKRTLAALAQHYGVGFDADEAHNAVYDVTKTMEVTREVINKYGYFTNGEQADMYRTWAEHLQDYFRKTDPDAVVESGWPLRGVA